MQTSLKYRAVGASMLKLSTFYLFVCGPDVLLGNDDSRAVATRSLTLMTMSPTYHVSPRTRTS